MRSDFKRRRQRMQRLLAGFMAVCLLGVLAIFAWLAYELVPGVRFRVDVWLAEAYSVANARPAVLPTAAQPISTLIIPTPALPSATPSATPEPTQPGPTATPEPTSTPVPPTPTWVPVPASFALTNFRHEYQKFNNCGPTSLSIILSYWGWEGNQATAAATLKPVQDDKNVSPREMYEYMLTQGYDAYIRYNGDLDTLRRFIANGYPVLVEKGLECFPGERCTGWFGHYSVFTGYDDATQKFTVQDSYRGPNLKLTYTEVLTAWRSFTYIYMVPFPNDPGHRARVQYLLGEDLDLDLNYRKALARAQTEALTSTGADAAFAWFGVGMMLHNLQDYAGAAQAFDQARAIGLPYRMMWYQFGAYRSYYYMGRYRDVIDLATFAIDSTPNPGLEEAFYWRGQAYAALGQADQARQNYQQALEMNPNYLPAKQALGQ